MITEPNEFMQRLQELQDSSSVTYFTLPSNEPRFIIDANSRTIKILPEFQFLGVKNDHKAETVYFEIDRYFDTEDLSTHTCVIQFENKSGEGGIYPVTIMDTESINGKIIFGWEILSDATTIVGDIIFSVRFYSLDNYVFTYNFNTLPAKSAILDTLNVDDPTVVENYPSELEAWLDRMDDLSQNVVKPEDVELLDTKMDTLETSFGELNSSVDELKEDLNDHTRVLDNKVFNLTTVDLSNSEFGYYDFNGIFQSSSYSKCISVDCNGNSVFELTLDVTANARYGIIFTDVFNYVISREIIGEDNTTRVTNKIVYAPSNTKHALVTWDVKEDSRIPSVFIGVENVIKRIKTLPYIIPWTRRGYYNEQGKVENNNYSYYCEIDTSEYRNKEVIIKGYVHGDARCLFRTCDINGNIIDNYYRGINSEEPTYKLFETTFLIPSNCYSIKMTSMNENYPCSGVFVIENNEIVISDYSLSPFKDLKFVAYGDSTTEIGHWVELIQEELQFKSVLNLGWGGSMLATESLDSQFSVFSIWPGAWDDRIAEIPNDTDVITIMFGTNDCGYGNAMNGDLGSIDSTDTNYYYGAYNYLISKLYEKNPYMKIFLCTSAYTGEETRVEGFHEHLDLCREATINIARKYNLPLIEMRENGINELNRTFYHEDSSHPNVLGGKQFARPIIAKLKSFYYGL